MDGLVRLIDRILPEYTEIWHSRNFETGIARFLDHLLARRTELLALREQSSS